MAEELGRLTASLRADVRRWQSDLRAAETSLSRLERAGDRSGSRLRRSLDAAFTGAGRLAKSLFSLRTAAVAAAGTTGLALLFRRSVDFADSIGKTADRLGFGVEALQRWRFAASQSGVEANTFDLALQRFTRRTAEAAQGTGEAKDALEQLGIQLTDNQGNLRPTEELLLDVADRLSQVTDQGDRVRIAFKLFDSEGVSLLNLLQRGRGTIEDFGDELERTGGVLEEDVVRGAEATKDALSRLSTVIQVNLTRGVLGVQDDVRDFADILSDPETVEGVKELATAIGALARGIAEFGAALAKIPRKPLDFIDEKLNELAEQGFQFGGELGEELNRELARRSRALAPGPIPGIGAPFERIPGLGVPDLERFGGRPSPPPGTGSGIGLSEKQRQALAKAAEERRKLEQQITQDLLQETGRRREIIGLELEERFRAIDEASFTGADATRLRLTAVQTAEAKITAITQEEADKRADLADRVTQAHLEATEQREALILRERDATLKAIEEAGFAEQEAAQLRVRAHETATARIQELHEDNASELNRLGEFALDGLSTALADMLIEGEFTFDRLAKSFARMLLEMEIRAAASSLFQSAGGSTGGTGGSIISSLGGALLGVFGFQEGGIVTRPTLAVIGEGHEAEGVFPLSTLSEMGGGAEVVINIRTIREPGVSQRQRAGGGQEIDIDEMVSGAITGGPKTGSALRSVFGLNRAGQRR